MAGHGPADWQAHCARRAMPRVAKRVTGKCSMKEMERMACLLWAQLAIPSATLPPTSTALQKAPLLLPPETEPCTLA